MDWQPLDRNDVIAAEDGRLPTLNARTAEVGELLDYLETQTGKKGMTSEFPCKVLKPGGQWIKGKIRVAIEFCSDE